MAQICFAERLREVGPTQLRSYPGARLLDVLDAVSRDYPRLKPYVLDEQGRVRKHVAIFIDGELRRGQAALELALTPASEIYVMQALSGG